MADTFIYGNRYLNESEQKNNADVCYSWFRGIQAERFSLNATCAIVANFEYESTINPGITEGLTTDPEAFKQEHGYYPGCGLAGWTPYTKLTDWLNSIGVAADFDSGWQNHGNLQLEFILWQLQNTPTEVWFRNPQVSPSDPPMTFAEFCNSDLDPATLAKYWCWYYEHPADPVGQAPLRAAAADKWYTYFTGVVPPGPQPPTPISKPKGLPVWMMLRKKSVRVMTRL